jgi:hypothetical protein
MRARIAIVPFAAAAALAASAGAAHASPPPVTVHASTKITDRPDGGNGNPQWWADDTMTRTLKITKTGGTPGHWTFDAEVTDKGTFTTRKGAPTPNQGGSYAGDTIQSTVTGAINGTVDYSFTATSLPSSARNLGVPPRENDNGNPLNGFSTPLWYELAFPAGTTFGGDGIGAWSWTYKATVITATSQQVCLTRGWCWPVPAVHVSHQQWVDASSNADGDLPADGNVTG